MLEKALDYIIGVVTENEEVKKFPKDFVTTSMQWIRSWFLIDDPKTEAKINDPMRSEESKRTILEGKLEDLQENPTFMKELEERLAAFSAQREKLKNVIDGGNIEAQGNVHIGDVNSSNDSYDQKNIIKGSTIKAGGDFRLGDDVIANNQNVNITNHYYGKQAPTAPKGSGNQNIDDIQNYIAKGNTRKAIDALLDLPNVDNQQQNQVLLLSGRLAQLDRQINMGIIDSANAGIERARINNAVLNLLNELKSEG